MHTLETAGLFKEKAKGNARTIYNDSILVRMRNTIFLNGQDDQKKILASIEDGLYLITPGRGITNKYGNFVIEIVGMR